MVAAIFAPTIEVLIAARFMQGVGTAVGWSISRAMVRDLFTNEQSARMMNLIGLIMGLGPALAPTIGGLTMELAGWQAIFVLMALFGIAVVLVVHFAMVETVVRDLSRFRPRASWRATTARCSRIRGFRAASLVMAGSIGALYTQADDPALHPDGPRRPHTDPIRRWACCSSRISYFFGSLVVRQLMGASAPFGSCRSG